MDKASLLKMDVSGSVNVTDPQSVCDAVLAILNRRYPGFDFAIIKRLYADFAALYRGELDGFLACDTTYHDIQHVLDVSLAMARLLDGYDINHSGADQLGPELAVIGMIVALFHDAGYIRRANETAIRHGAEYTKIHVSRSARFMAEYLPGIGRADLIELTGKLVHFTGYEVSPDQIELNDPQLRLLGNLVGTADVIAQMADPAYLEKCRDRLFPEFELGGMARQTLEDGSEKVVYESAEDLLIKTPQFIKATITGRLDGHFDRLYRQVEAHFGGANLYMEALERNCQHLEALIAQGDRSLLRSTALSPRISSRQ
jgi:hypothetical protein